MRFPWNRKPQVKQNPVNKFILQGLPKDGVWTPRDYKNLSEAGYKNCMTAFSCINKITNNAAEIEWQVEDQEGDVLDRHPLLQLLKRPNPQQSKQAFIEQVLGYLLITGNSYIFQASGGGKPRYLYCLRPDRMQVLPGSGFDLVRGYRYTVNGVAAPDFAPEQILHIKLFNPLNDFYGMGPVEAAARGIDISNYSDTWNAAVIKNDMRPPGILKAEGSLTPEMRERLKNQIREEWQGMENAGNPIVLEGGLTWQGLSMSPKDLEWLNSNKATLRNICTVFNVPPQLMGDTEASTYSNYQEARKALIGENVLPRMNRLTGDIDNWLMPMYGGNVNLTIDKSQIEALKENITEKYNALNFADFLTLNEKREAADYDPIGPEGDVILVPMGKVPLEFQVEKPEPVPAALAPSTLPEDDEPVEGEVVDEEPVDDEEGKARRLTKESHWTNLKRKEMLWRSFDSRVKAREKTFEQIAKEYLRRQAESITAKVNAADSLSDLEPGSILDVKKETKKYESSFMSWYTDHFLRAHAAGTEATKGNIFDDASYKADPPTSWVASMTEAQQKALKVLIHNSGTNVNKTALDKIEAMLIKANELNWTVAELADKLSKNVFDLVQWRAELWARTESAKVDNYGQVEGYKDTEFVEKKGWMCSFVPDSRDAHMDADGQERKLDDDFNVGGESIPHPGAGSPGNACNCLCSTYPIVGEL